MGPDRTPDSGDPAAVSAPPTTPPAPLAAGDYVFTLNRFGRDVSVIPARAPFREERRIALRTPRGSRPQGMAVDGASGTLYVSFPDENLVVAYGFNGAERARAVVNGWVSSLALDHGRRLLAAPYGGGVEFLDAVTLRPRARVATGSARVGAYDVAIDAAAGVAAVSHSLSDEIALVSLDDFRVTARIPTDAYPAGLRVSGGTVYVSARDADRLAAFRISDGSRLFSVATGNGPNSLDVDAASNRVLVGNDLGGEVSLLDGGTGAELARWSLGHAIPDVALDPTGVLLFVCDSGSDRVDALDAATGARVASIPSGDFPVLLRAVRIP
ncbi:MAG: hypothetical protein H0V09_06975 [Gemmatimonadetes bacterium]|nr:hypothetical protein [Gemmatimonadota bacterium]